MSLECTGLVFKYARNEAVIRLNIICCLYC